MSLKKYEIKFILYFLSSSELFLKFNDYFIAFIVLYLQLIYNNCGFVYKKCQKHAERQQNATPRGAVCKLILAGAAFKTPKHTHTHAHR